MYICIFLGAISGVYSAIERGWRRANPCERQYEAERFNDAYDIFALSKWAACLPALGVQRKKKH